MNAIEWKHNVIEIKFSDVGAQGTFSGYGSVFDVIDDGGDVIKHGAFAQSLSQDMPKMYLNHAGVMFKTTTAMDMVPIGIWTSAQEDSKGLSLDGRLINLDTERGKTIYGAMKEGALKGLSIGYRAINPIMGTKAGGPKRTICQAKLYEVSVVDNPMNRFCSVDQIKSNGNPLDIRFLEDALRDAGLSRSEAKAVLAHGFKALAPLREAAVAGSMNGLLDALKGTRSTFSR